MQSRIGARSVAPFLLLLALPLGWTLWGQESGDLEAFRKLQNDLRERMAEDLGEATEYLETLIADSPDSADLNVLRHSLASRYLQRRDYKAANAQFQKLLEFQIKHLQQAENQFGVWMTVQSIQEIAEESGDSKAFRSAVDRSFDALTAIGAEVESTLMPLSELAVLKAQLLTEEGQVELGDEIVRAQLSKLRDINDSDQATEQTMRILLRTLRSLTAPDRGNDSWRDDYVPELDELVSSAIECYPDSATLQNEYADTQLLMITRWKQEDPEATEQRLEQVAKNLSRFALKNPSVLATLRRLELHKERMAAVKPVATLVGKPAPPWDVDAWIGAVGVTPESWKGEVVLLDFWAMWCGPCIATFPHLREWREEFGDQGFEIIGVTQYYNFEWDEENKRASRATEEVSREEEHETLTSFLAHHRLEHPVIVTPKESEMSSEYGVRGIPHVVLIDRDGQVQLVKTGAGEATAKEIHAKIKELLASEVVDPVPSP